jgi:hypothetical protein
LLPTVIHAHDETVPPQLRPNVSNHLPANHRIQRRAIDR